MMEFVVHAAFYARGLPCMELAVHEAWHGRY